MIAMKTAMEGIIAVFAICAFLASCGIAAAASDTTNDKVIHASGTGTVIGTPDRAQISFSIQTENADVKAAQQANALQMNKVVDALVAAGIPKDALKTTGYSIYPVYEDSKGPFDTRKVKTYQVTNTLTVTLHEVSKAGDVIDIAVANGINQASSIHFLLSDEQSQALMTQALAKAVERARADADTVARALNVTITDTKSCEITGGYSPVLYENYAVGASLAKSAAPTPI
jgi:uncharacterized protein YggE